ncbi:hypothetical protein D8B26_001393 [Coccidioides posadasii str. Silveira]|uniref:RING-type E3 ubiquitin transferase n=2 Tax=Coccidioides posadasii TaxID=199306 RepID=E9D9N1_COCPS|nr:C3HC4 type (RING finger) zinc finger containing protein [Coccidioides posadasii C735 delta SOWgp]EER23301.1 C3HC4 type (RING finger) zinc finger containing protein [Coccidioides posadasii C735 delta SOWgp]EFW16612.1 conserved hypothetical protein [Coccidioides posadasii str. Silveira]QVM06686.1 hypothetical protein D8B26_001393 [Coccidioides posadasii str. Silveira]|eukprot:XP_003065446.1 C3HC4 type (RING finger) zinc finger containing protein [Coccidioides posadasii C735 delta SOWgp]
MRPPRLLLLLACFIFLPVLLTTFSLVSARFRRGTAATSTPSHRTGRLRALFSFHAPSALFPPSAIISLTEDNSTFFLARPAAFGPPLPSKGLSGPLWIGSGFSDDTLRKGGVGVAAEGELGCSDVPGWEDGSKNKNVRLGAGTQDGLNNDGRSEEGAGPGVALNNRQKRSNDDVNRAGGVSGPSEKDGTDDHLHHPLPQSYTPDPNLNGGAGRPNDRPRDSTHADIQSLQESAEISGKVVLLSRGGCGFLEKVKWVQRRGGIALIVGDDTRGGGLVTMYARGDTSNVTIPAVFTSYTTAHLLSSLVPPERAFDAPKIVPGDGKQKIKPSLGKGKATSSRGASKPKVTSLAKSDSSRADNHGFLQSLASFFGFSGRKSSPSNIQEDSRRPPSSGNIDWPSHDTPDQGKKSDKQAGGVGSSLNSPQPASNDDFVIGVQDWRDPDLVPVKTSTSVLATATPLSRAKGRSNSGQKGNASKQDSDSGVLEGGSTTPRSGEYRTQKDSLDEPGKDKSSGSKSRHWWSGHFRLGGSKENDPPPAPESPKIPPEAKKFHGAAGSIGNANGGNGIEREGLWVTLTPTSMSTSPFFDTLLVLVVSPLITLTVVYALLLLRSRIRRRRWRAPKAIVDRLPVRTYHTISNVSTPNTPSPDDSSPSSPLLSHSRPHSPRPRPRSQTCGPISASSNSLDPGHDKVEKSRSGSTLWRRKYTGRQVECVVCLEEYIDGLSKVMSLPCGHEFHVECITPWLTTRRRTCPICKGDVVRSLGAAASGRHMEQIQPTSDDGQAQIAETRNDSPTSAIPIPEDDLGSDLERGVSPSASLLGNSHGPAAAQSSWRNLANLSLSALSGDSMWHQSRHTRSPRNR